MGAADNAATVAALIERAVDADGVTPLSDQIAESLRDGLGITIVGPDGEGFAHLAPRLGAWTMQVVVDPARRDDPRIATALAMRARAAVAAAGGGRVDWWVFGADDADDAVA